MRDLNTNLEDFKFSRARTRTLAPTTLSCWRFKVAMMVNTDTAAALHVQSTGARMHSPDAMKLKASGTPKYELAGSPWMGAKRRLLRGCAKSRTLLALCNRA